MPIFEPVRTLSNLTHLDIRYTHAIHDLIPSDTRFKVLAFVGNVTHPRQVERINDLARALGESSNFFKRFGGSDPYSFDSPLKKIYSFCLQP